MDTPWGKIKAAYLKGGVTYKELGEKYHVAEKTIRNRASKEGWKKDRDEIKTRTGQKLIERVSDARTREIESIFRATDKMGDVLDRLLDELTQMEGGRMIKSTKEMANVARAIGSITRAKRDLFTLTEDRLKREHEMDGGGIAWVTKDPEGDELDG